MIITLAGRTAVVTGASRGIGAATARALDAAGARVVLVARGEQALREVAAGLANDPVVVVADLVGDDMAALGRSVLDQVGVVDVLVNNAAVAARVSTLDTKPSVVDQMLAANVRNLFLLTAALLPSMIGTGHGAVVNMTSVSGLRGTPNRAAYAASKSAVEGMTRALAQEFGGRGVRVNSVAPGVIDTALWARNKAVPGVVEGINAQIPLGRWGTPEEVADVIVFLASDAARYVTAQNLCVDGGMGHTLDLYGGAV